MTSPTSLQQAFLDWLHDPASSLARRVLIDAIRDDQLTFHFDVGFPALVGWLNERELTIAVMEGDEMMDLIFDCRAMPVQDGDQWRCSICAKQGKDELLASPDALWVDYLFTPFAQWVNGTLARAATLVIYRYGDGSWAKLVPPVGPPATGPHVSTVISLCQSRPHLA